MNGNAPKGRLTRHTWTIPLGSKQLMQPVNKHLSDSDSRPILHEMQGLL